MADRVTNEAVLVALRNHGVVINGPISMTGAQNSEWKTKMYQAALPYLQTLGPYTRDYFDDLFSKAIDTAKKIQDIPVDAKPIERLSQTLGAYGISGQQLHDIMDEAIRIRKTTPGYYQGGEEFGIEQYAQAAANLLGHTGPVLDAFANSGIKPETKLPQQGTKGAEVTPPPPAPGAPAPPPGTKPAAAMGQTLPGDVRAVDTAASKPTATGPSKPPGTKPPGDGTSPGNLGTATKDYSKYTDQQLEAEIRKTFGKNVWVLNIPEIKDIVFREMRNPSGVTQDVIDSAIQNTPWWQQNGSTVREYLQKQATDPGLLKENIEGRTREIERYAITFGMKLTPEKLSELANEAEKWQWDVDDVKAALAGEFDTNEGDSTAFIEGLKAEARDYLIPLSENTIDTWGKRIIMNGEAEQANWRQFLAEQAAGMFPGMRDRLMAGESVMDVAKPFRALAATTLEMNEADIDFMQPQWMAALDTVDEKGVHRTMTPAEWTRKIKTDSVYRYDYTETAKKQATGMATDLLKKFGAI